MPEYGTPTGYQEPSLKVERNKVGPADAATVRAAIAAHRKSALRAAALRGQTTPPAVKKQREPVHAGRGYSEIIDDASK